MSAKNISEVQKKGFIRVIEVVLFSFIILVVVLPNLLPETAKIETNNWKDINDRIICNDLLYSLEYKNDFDDVLIPEPPNASAEHNNDLNLLNNVTKNSFPPTIDFEYEVKGVSGYDVFVGVHDSCNLSQEIFSPNYPPLSINTATLNLSDLLSNDSFNAYIICGGGNLSHYESGVKDLLNKGKGFILVRNFNSAPDLLTKEIFQIDYSGGGSSTDSITFYNLSHPNSGRIAKRFINNIVRINTSGGSGQLHLRSNDYLVNVSSSCVNISGSGCGCLLEGDSCNFSGMIVRIYQIDPGLNWFDIKLSSSAANPRDYSFADDVPFTVNSNNHTVLSPASNSGKSLLNIQVLEEYSKSYETAPRAFWIYDFNKTRDDLKLLFRTGLIWVAGEHSLIFNKNIPEESTYCMHYYSGINGNNIPYIVKLHYWGY